MTLHTLRHTYASRLVLAGVDLVTIRKPGGWSEKGGLNLVQRYAHVGEGLKRDAVGALARGERGWFALTPGLTPSDLAHTKEPMAAAG